MGSGGKNKAPKAPDYANLARQDAEQQRITAEQITAANRPTQIDQYGNSINWSKDASGNPIQTVNMDPTIKAGQDANVGGYYDRMRGLDAQGGFTSPGALQYSNQNYDLAGGGSRGGSGGGSYSTSSGGGSGQGQKSDLSFEDISKFAGTGYGKIKNFNRKQGNKVAADLYESVMGRARPEQARESAALDNKLRLQGLQPGTAAYDRAYQNLMTSHGDVSTQAGLNSTLAGYNAARDIYNTNLAGQAQRYGQGRDTWNAEMERQKQIGDQTLGEGQIDASRYGSDAAASAARASAAASAAASRYGADLNYNLGVAQQRQSEQAQMWNQALTEYQLPTNMAQGYAGLMGQAPQPSFQGFSGATGYNPASMSNAAQNTYNANMAGYNAQQGKKGNLANNATSLGGAYMMRPV